MGRRVNRERRHVGPCLRPALATHHLDGPARARLFEDLAPALAAGGVVVVCDPVESQRKPGLEPWKRYWDDGSRGRSLKLDGDERMRRIKLKAFSRSPAGENAPFTAH